MGTRDGYQFFQTLYQALRSAIAKSVYRFDTVATNDLTHPHLPASPTLSHKSSVVFQTLGEISHLHRDPQYL